MEDAALAREILTLRILMDVLLTTVEKSSPGFLGRMRPQIESYVQPDDVAMRGPKGENITLREGGERAIAIIDDLHRQLYGPLPPVQ